MDVFWVAALVFGFSWFGGWLVYKFYGRGRF